MTLPSVFETSVLDELKRRIHSITANTQPQWGTMSADQVMAHLNVTYEYLYEPGQFKAPNAIMKFFLKTFVKSAVCGSKPYPKGSRTAPDFIKSDSYQFEAERDRLIAFLDRVQRDGAASFEGKESHSFGKLTADEWNTMFYKHLDHHLKQFGA